MSGGKRSLWTLLDRWHQQFWGRFGIAFVLTVVALAINMFLVEKTTAYGRLRLWTYGGIQRMLRVDSDVAEPPVRVVDIAGVATEDNASTAPGGPAVSRADLLAALTTIAQAGALGIAVDVDFSPDENGNPITLEDGSFFRRVLRLSRETGVPIYLGVDRHAAGPPEERLGGQDFAPLAAGLGVGNDSFQAGAAELHTPVSSVLRMLAWTQVGDASSRLKALAYALAQPRIDASRQPPSWLGWALETKSEFSPEAPLDTQGFLVNYRLLDDFLADHSGVAEAADDAARFENRFVILGDVRRTEERGDGSAAHDLFQVPGREGYYSGVLLHACAVDTLVHTPLLQWTHAGRIALDFGLAVFGFLSIELLRWAIYARRGLKSTKPAIEWVIAGSTAIAILLVSTLFASSIRLIWDDAIYIATALLLHTWLEQRLSAKIHEKVHAH